MVTRWAEQIRDLRRICFDSNALVYLLEGILPYTSFVDQALGMVMRGEARGFISTVVEMEMLVYPLRERKLTAFDHIELFLRDMPNLVIRNVDRAVARRAAEVRARTRLAPLDAIIAATAIEERCDAIIGNDAMMAARLTPIPYLYLNDYV